MLLAPIFLAAALGQCPEPPSRYGPPPCAAANVPGCLPGYRRQIDAYGRVVYVCDRNAAAPAPAPQEMLPGPAEPEARAAPPPYAPAPQYATRYPVAPAPPPRRGILGLVLMPGASSVNRGHTTDPTGAVALELRAPFGGARLRFGYEFSEQAHAVDVGLKYDFLERMPIRPFLAVGVGGASLAQDPGWGPSASLSGGLDLYVTRDIFATVEVKRRVFTRDTQDGFDISSIHQTSVFAGLGFYF